MSGGNKLFITEVLIPFLFFFFFQIFITEFGKSSETVNNIDVVICYISWVGFQTYYLSMTSISSQFHKLLSSIHNPGCCKTERCQPENPYCLPSNWNVCFQEIRNKSKEQTEIVRLIDFKNAAINVHLRHKLTSSRPLSSQQNSCWIGKSSDS